MNIIVRYGPAPEDTADAEGRLHAVFSGFFLAHASPDEAELLETVPGALYAYAAGVWRRATAEGHGHVLIGQHKGLVYAAGTTSPWGCGGDEGGAIPCRPSGYTPLFAVARTRRPEGVAAGPDAPDVLDLAIDYRGTGGPGDTGIRPVVFDVGAPGAQPVCQDGVPAGGGPG